MKNRITENKSLYTFMLYICVWWDVYVVHMCGGCLCCTYMWGDVYVVHMWWGDVKIAYVEVKGELEVSISPSTMWLLETRTLIIMPEGKCYYPLSHFTSLKKQGFSLSLGCVCGYPLS